MKPPVESHGEWNFFSQIKRISAADVTQHAKRIITGRGTSGASAAGAAVPEVVLPDFSKWGPVERQPLRAIRRKAVLSGGSGPLDGMFR